MGAAIDKLRHDQGGAAFGQPANVDREGQWTAYVLFAPLALSRRLGASNDALEVGFDLGVPLVQVTLGHHALLCSDCCAAIRSRRSARSLSTVSHSSVPRESVKRFG